MISSGVPKFIGCELDIAPVKPLPKSQKLVR